MYKQQQTGKTELMEHQREKDIKIIIADRTYRIKVLPEDEERVNLAAKIIKHRMREMQDMYGAKDKYDYLAMAALTICVDLLEKQEQIEKDNQETGNKLTQLDEILADFISKQ
ncbi:cell division protein ZapA [Sphingobacteriales bacterium UPWRP_1]|nr:hypothetical protein BVG80_03125 [Sphingobacteriales bacterium TSM_CSM]PSJ75530.1 cell division protein ZapA [Sphingobacteriales bacterium UPWRP_1]